MIVYRCDHCGETIADRLRVTLRRATGDNEHFCSIPCVTTWARWAGYYKPPTDGVVDAEIYCGSSSPAGPAGRDCKFVNGHSGSHVDHRGEEWT